jgi:hypothetical protein
MALASSLILAGCGTKPASSSASETGTSSSESASSSSSSSSSASSSSSSSSPSPIDPEAAYKVSEAEFIDIFLNKLANVTVNIDGKSVSSVMPKQIVYSGRLEKGVGAFSGSEVDYYNRVDVSGVETGIAVIADQDTIYHVAEPYDTGATDTKNIYEVARAHFLYSYLGFSGIYDLVPSYDTRSEKEIYVSDDLLTPCLKSVYASLAYDSSTHSYQETMQDEDSGASVTLHLSFVDQYLTESSVVTVTSKGTTTTLACVYSQYGSSLISSLSTENANYLDYFTIRFFDDDENGEALLEKKYVGYGQPITYTGSYRHKLEDDTGSFTIQGWKGYGSNALVPSSFLQAAYGSHDLMAVWERVENKDIYDYDSTSGTLSLLGGLDGIGSLKVPSTYNDMPVNVVNLDDMTSDLTEVYLPASVGEVWKTTTDESEVFLSQVEFSVDSVSEKLKVENGALLKKDGTVLYSYYANGTTTKYVASLDLTTIIDFAFAKSTLQELDLSASSIQTLDNGVFLDSENLMKVAFPKTLQEIGQSCFKDCIQLAALDLKDTVLTSIGDEAFSYSESLESATFPSTLQSIGKKAFEDSKLQSIHLPASFKAFGASAFQNCSRLTEVTFDASIDAPDLLADGAAFAFCTQLRNCVIPDCVTSIGEDTFEDDGKYVFNLPSQLKTIGQFAFVNTLGPSTLTLPASVTDLGASAFKNVRALTSADLSATKLTELSSSAFEDCSSLSMVTIPSTLVKLDSLCFANTALMIFTITANMSFASNAFRGCKSLVLANLNTTNYALDATGRFVYDATSTNLLVGVGNPTSYVAPSTLTKTENSALASLSTLTKADFSMTTSALTMGANLFQNDQALTSVVFPSTKVTLNSEDFENTGFTSVTLPSNVDFASARALYHNCAKLVSADLSATTSVTMQSNFFASCPLLSSVKLSSSLTEIYSAAFSKDLSLKSLVIPSSVTKIQTHAFDSCSTDLKFYLEATSLPSGYVSGWNTVTRVDNAEYLLYSETEPDYTSAGTQRYWHYDANKNPVIWVKA